METLQQLQEKRAGVLASIERAQKSQEYSVGGGGLGRKNRLPEIEQQMKMLNYWDKLIAAHPETIAAQRLAARRRVAYLRPLR